MDAGLGKVVKKELEEQYNKVESEDNKNCDYDRFVFTNCRNLKPKEVRIRTNPRSPSWQVGFFDTDEEVCFDKIMLKYDANFSSIVRNYWWNEKEREEKKEGYYSLIKSATKLEINEKHVNDLLDYVEGRYDAGEHWQIHKLDKNIQLKIYGELEETTVKRLQKHFDDIWCSEITANLKTVNNITYNCDQYQFRNCKEAVPQKLVINATVEHISFLDANNEVRIPEIVMEEKADLESIIQNNYEGNKYSLLPHVQTMVIRNNLKLLYDLANYINRRYKMEDNWKLYELNKNMKIVIEKPGIAFDAVKEISNYFTDVLVDDNKPEEYIARQQPYWMSFQEHFNKYDLRADQIGNLILASQEFQLKDRQFNIRDCNKQINKLQIDQKITQQQFICFHDTTERVVIDKIVIEDNGDLRCVLQNAYYDGMDSGFFSLLRTAKELEIHSDQDEDNQVLDDLADYIEEKYVLNANWKQEELNKDMRINIDSGGYSLSLSAARRLRKYFRNVLIDCIWTRLETENIIDQECENQYIFTRSKQVSPQKLIISAMQMDSGILILFNNADGEVHIPEITIDQQGYFAAIVRNHWQNNEEGDEEKSGFYSLIQHVQTLVIRNNPGALKDLADYVAGKYKIGNSKWQLQQLSKDTRVVLEGSMDTFLHVFRISKYFQSVTVDGKQVNDYIQTIEQEESRNPDYMAFRTCFETHGLLARPLQYGVEVQEKLELIDYAYNIRKSMASINSLTVRQKLDINQFVCFHDIDKAVTVDKIIIDDVGNLRSVLQNAYYSNGQAGFFSLLKTAKELEIRNNQQAVEDLADYVDGKYALHSKWGVQALNKSMKIKLHHNSRAFSLDVARRLRKYFRNVSIDCIWTQLETENVITQDCENQYIFGDCRDTNPEKLVVDVKLAGSQSLILFNNADGEVCIPKITIDKHGGFDAIVRNFWRNCKNDNEEKEGYYSLVSHVETLTIQNNLQVVCDFDRYVSGDYRIQDNEFDQYDEFDESDEYNENNRWEVQELSKNIIVRINGVKGLDEQINRLKEYFNYIFVDDRKALGTQRREAIVNIKLDSSKIQQQSISNADKRSAIARADAEIAETRRRIERARARLGRRRARFQEYLALTE